MILGGIIPPVIILRKPRASGDDPAERPDDADYAA